MLCLCGDTKPALWEHRESQKVSHVVRPELLAPVSVPELNSLPASIFATAASPHSASWSCFSALLVDTPSRSASFFSTSASPPLSLPRPSSAACQVVTMTVRLCQSSKSLWVGLFTFEAVLGAESSPSGPCQLRQTGMKFSTTP